MSDNDMTRGLPPITRRQLLAGGAMAGTAAFLAACGTSGTATQSAAPSESASASAAAASESASASAAESATPGPTATPSPTLNWANWTYYIDVDPNDPNKHPTLDGFKKKYGTTVSYKEVIDANESFYGTIKDALNQNKDTGWDVITLTDWMAARLVRQGWVEQLDLNNMPDFVANLKDTYKGIDWDPTNDHHAPWRSGTTGIGFNSKVVSNPTSLKTLFTVDPKTKGKVEYLTEMRDAVGLAMLYLGLDPAKPTRAGCDQAVAAMQKAKDDGIVRSVKGQSYTEDLKSGDAVLCMAWAGDMIQAHSDTPSLAYNLPDEGGMLWTDNMMIPKGAAHKGTAELLMNYYYDPAVSAEITHATDYLSPCKGSDEVLLSKYPADAKNPLIVPPADWVARFHIFGALSSDDETYFNKQFAKVMGVG
ncbi:MAG TPA: spermidine/putrescine ABC transporter substrate-binding protein [Candidatus Limnocylindrales bacterium]